jgi:methylmalonyl-CoA epimerase
VVFYQNGIFIHGDPSGSKGEGVMLKKIEHIGVAVQNIEKSIPLFRDILGIPLEKVYESDAIKTKIAFFPLGDSTIELIEAMDPSSPVAKFIQKRGEGIHHICFGVENVEAALRHFEAQGIELLNKQPRRTENGDLIAFLNPKSTNGILIELVEMRAEQQSMER